MEGRLVSGAAATGRSPRGLTKLEGATLKILQAAARPKRLSRRS